MEKENAIVPEYVVKLPLPENQPGIQRVVTMTRIKTLDFIAQVAELEYIVEQFDPSGTLTRNPNLVASRVVTIPLSNTDRVIDGMLIEKNDPRYEEAVPEFDWWMSNAMKFPLIAIIQQGTQMLIATGRFDRI